MAGVVHNQRGAATFALAAFPYVTLIVLCHLFFIYDVVVARALALRAITRFSRYVMQASFLKEET